VGGPVGVRHGAFEVGGIEGHRHRDRSAEADRLWSVFAEGYETVAPLAAADLAAAPAFALARLLQVHAHDNPVGAAGDRWPATW